MIKLLLVPTLTLGIALSAATLRFAPEDGSRWTKTYEVTTELEGAELEVIMDGQPVPSEYLPQLDMQMTLKDEYELTDTYVRTVKGRPIELKRTYATIASQASQTLDMGGFEGAETQEFEVSGTSELVGETIFFEWDADEESYTTAFAEGSETDATLLDGLTEDTDFRDLLPQGEAEAAGELEVGAEWTADASAIAALLLQPGSELHIVYEGEGAEEYNKQIDEASVEGEVKLTLQSTSQEDGRNVATIAVEAEAIVVASGPGSLEQVPGIDGAATETTTIEYLLEGELTWDLDANYASALSLEGDLELDVHVVRDPSEPGPTFETTAKLDGKAEFQFRAERAE
ncbi:MAG: hypothetical protein GY711_20480 [bacterium]|nr:hypothetical protein [bacterium]